MNPQITQITQIRRQKAEGRRQKAESLRAVHPFLLQPLLLNLCNLRNLRMFCLALASRLFSSSPLRRYDVRKHFC